MLTDEACFTFFQNLLSLANLADKSIFFAAMSMIIYTNRMDDRQQLKFKARLRKKKLLSNIVLLYPNPRYQAVCRLPDGVL